MTPGTTRVFLAQAATALTVAVIAASALAGCESSGSSSASNSAVECDGNGTMHGDHCHCEAGYEVTNDGMGCVAQSTTSDSAGGQGDVVNEVPTDVGPVTPRGNDAHTGGDHGHGDDAGPSGSHPELVFEPSSVQAATVLAEDGSQVWLLEAVDGDAVLGIELYEGFGSLTSPGVTPLTAVETSYETCGTCLILRTGCVAHGDHYDCATTLMPRAEGEVHIDAISKVEGSTFAGALLGLTFQEVTIASNYKTQVVAGGEELYLAQWIFNTKTESAGGGSEECGGHGQRHFDHCDCDPGYYPDPQNPLNCIPQ